MKLITLDNKSYDIKYMQSKESITFKIAGSVHEYPDFSGSKIYSNSASSNRYALTFAVHRSLQEELTRSLKVILTNTDDAIENETYGKLTDLVLEHRLYGALFGRIIGEIKINTSGEADVIYTCLFQVNTRDEYIIKKDLENENTSAVDAIYTETTDNFDVELSAQDSSVLGKLSDSLNSLYSKILNSSVVAAFNDANAEINAATLDSQRIMNAFKSIISLPNVIYTDTEDSVKRIELLQLQAESIQSTTISSYNLALFNANMFSYNVGLTSKAAFISEEAAEEAAGLKSVPLT